MERRLGDRAVTLFAHNAVVEDAQTDWLDGIDGVILGGSGEYSVQQLIKIRGLELPFLCLYPVDGHYHVWRFYPPILRL